VLALCSAYVLGTLVPAGDTLQRFLLGHQTFYNRYASTGFDPNDLALTLDLSLPMSYYLALKQKGPIRWVYYAQMLAAIGTIFMTVSRGGTFCMLIALSLIVWTVRSIPVRNRIVIAAMFAIAVVGAATLVPATSWKRLASAASEVSEGTLNSRTVLWKAGLHEFRNMPFGGVGAGAYPETSAKVIGRPWAFVAVAHNSYISVLVETGVIGFALFAVLLALFFRLAFRMPRITRAFWLTMLGVWMIGVCSLTWEYRKPTWLLFGLLAAHAMRVQPNFAASSETTVNATPFFNTAEAYS
jgi:O-antigen ligase